MYSKMLFVLCFIAFFAFSTAAPTGGVKQMHVLHKHDQRSGSAPGEHQEKMAAIPDVPVIREDTHEFQWAPQPPAQASVPEQGKFQEIVRIFLNPSSPSSSPSGGQAHKRRRVARRRHPVCPQSLAPSGSIH
ncbi:hypothetical protein FA15DRAFT_702660 [Coprinopsis marcescibilis]|uniref:Uncharacterized protein n=1 Tax=Coprinopsis marcescibilis TaxID=230819 RepID=A0A5C3L1K9_COPMA|nr:hypothetical protein FA15DRAFT_702660 [Coprinopsis marcescibilis]